MQKNFLVLLLGFFVLNLLDLLSTCMFLGLGGLEGNPIWYKFNTDGVGVFDILSKVGFGVLGCFMGYVMYYLVNKLKKHQSVMTKFIYCYWIGVDLVLIIVVCYNFFGCWVLMTL